MSGDERGTPEPFASGGGPSRGRARLRGTVLDGETGWPVPCKVKITDSEGGHPDTLLFQGRIPSYWCEGAFDVELPPGRTTVEITRGHEYDCLRETLFIAADETLEREFVLDRWINMRELGYLTGEGHTHVVRGGSRRSNIAYAALVARGEGLDYLCTGPDASEREAFAHREAVRTTDPDYYRATGGDPSVPNVYDGPEEPEPEEYCRQVSDPEFLMHRGNEGPKTRLGHVWWLNFKMAPGENTWDHDDWEYERWHYLGEREGPEPRYSREPVFEMLARRRGMGCCAVIAHPTQW